MLVAWRSMLFDPRAHEPLLGAAWRPADVAAAIRTIAREADEALRGRDWWLAHPLDAEDGDPDVLHGVYFGAAGVLWALHRLAQAGLHEPRHDYARLAEDVVASYRGRPEFDGPVPSVWMGEGGIALVGWLLSPTRALADRLAELVVVDPDRDTLELMWGSPGLLLIAKAMLERTGAHRWSTAWSAIADRLLLQWGAQVPDFWTQRLYGSTGEILGPAHGLAGVVAALARRPELLPADRLVPRTTAALSATAMREGDHANWPPARDRPLEDRSGLIRTQWCHGAPGINGFALLKLFTRTADESWLQRARRFAMHAAGQAEAARWRYGRGRHSLWTGDLGTAMYLQHCLAGASEVPAVDLW